VGEYAFADESDAHIAAQLRETFAFQGIRPELVGNRRRFVLGKNSGENILRHKLEELGLKADEEKVPLILDRIRQASAKRKGAIMTDDDLREIIQNIGG
jgi:(R)-citramalate synthase